MTELDMSFTECKVLKNKYQALQNIANVQSSNMPDPQSMSARNGL